MTRLALCCVLLLAAGVANGARFALDLKGDGTFVQIKTDAEVEGSEPYAATLELLFKPSNCTLQGIMSQRMILRAAKGDQSGYDGADVGVAAGDAVSQRDVEELAERNARLAESHDFVHERSVAGDGHVKPATMHGRGIMVDADGNFVVWSRDGKGVWRGVKVGQCVEDRWTHLALTQRGEFMSGFMDGAKRNTLKMDGHQGDGYVPYFTVGRLSDGKSAGFYSANGLVDEIRIYDRALNPQDVRCGVDTRITGRERGLAAYLRLDEGAGTTLISMALPSSVVADVVGTPVWVPSAGTKEIDVAPDAPDASTCVYDLSVAQPMGVHYNRLKEGQGCPNECSGHGKCDIQKGTCLCAAGFVGADCSTEQYQGYALQLDGAKQHVVLPPMGLHNSMQLEAWVKADDVSGVRPIRADMDVSADGAVDWSIEDGRVALTIAGNEPSKVTFETELEAEQWYFLSVAYSRKHANRTGTGSATLYVDGKPAGVQQYEKTVPVQLGAAWVGASKFNGGHFKGLIDELRIFARVATPIETAYFHAAGRLDGSELGLIAYYSFDEEGDMVIDRSRTGGTRHTIEFGDPVGGAPTELDAPVIGGAARANSDAPFLPCDEHCHAHGMCWNGTCACEEWYGGQWCKKIVCPNKCSGNGHCVVDNATMRFAEEISNATSAVALNVTKAIYSLNLHHMASPGSMLANLTAAVADASGDAAFDEARRAILDYMSKAEPKRCDCFDGFSGPDCSFRSCPNDCSDKGICVNGTCGCKAGWGGVDCSEKRCINHCSGKGECYDGVCVCDAGYTGDDCAQQAPCSGGCSGHGLCLDDTCECDDGWTGEKCEWGDGCPNFCSGRGRCVENQCICDTMFSGPDCGEVRCPRDCSGHGDCVDGTCTCEAGWSADDCSQSALWPMRCHSVRRGKRVTSQCRRGWVLATPTIGSQVLEIKYGNGEGGAKPFEGVLKEQDQPTVTPVQWSEQARQAGKDLAEMLRAGHFRDGITGGAGAEDEDEEGAKEDARDEEMSAEEEG